MPPDFQHFLATGGVLHPNQTTRFEPGGGFCKRQHFDVSQEPVGTYNFSNQKKVILAHETIR